uniref:XylU protein n=1 Tax=Stutzerimonas stutzeri TaxID=316 RepID=A0A0S2UNX3_STUST|nr:xylU protein [Stutzerimonas stutzeri]
MLYFLNFAQIGCFRHVYPQSGPAVAVTLGVCDAGLELPEGEPKQASPTTNFCEPKVIGVRATLRTICVAVIGFISRNRVIDASPTVRLHQSSISSLTSTDYMPRSATIYPACRAFARALVIYRSHSCSDITNQPCRSRKLCVCCRELGCM